VSHSTSSPLVQDLFPGAIRMTLCLLCHCSAAVASERVWEPGKAKIWVQTVSDCASLLTMKKTTPCACQHSWWRGDQGYDFLGSNFLLAVLSLLVCLVVSCRMETIGLSSGSGQASTCSAIEPCPMTSADQPLCSRPVHCSLGRLVRIVRQSRWKGENGEREVNSQCRFILQLESETYHPRSPLHYETRGVGLPLSGGIN
jgi:hypothetical protein